MALSTGEVVDNRYRIVKLLGQGGMGAVYRAWDVRLEKPVALKEMVPQITLSPEMLADLREQFRQEAQILATLVHPNLVRVTDYFSWEDNEYLVMDYVEGESLANLIERDGAQPESKVLVWMKHLLDALDYCHRQGVIHRDIKPQNIIITPEGRAVLVDFGLVKLWDPSAPETRTVMRGAGTPEYAPPEQYDMGVGHTDQRSDIYSVGATLYHALTGQVPPTATKRMASPVSFVQPRSANASISSKTEEVILKALEMAMDRRYQSAKSMAQALAGSRQQEVVGRPLVERSVKQPPPSKPAGVSAKRGILWGMGGAGLTVIVIVCLFVAGIAGLIVLGSIVETETPTEVSRATETATSSSTHTPSLPTDTVIPSTGTPVVPTATSLPTIMPEVEGLLFGDNFSDPGTGWTEWEDEEGSKGYGDGYYYVIGTKRGILIYGESEKRFSDVVVDVYATQISSTSDDVNAYGVACRAQSNGNGYLLRISGDGKYAIQRVIDDEFEFLVDWTESDVINQGNATNHIRATCDGTYLALSVNGIMLADVEDDTFERGRIGLATTTFGDVPTEVHFDDLLILNPSSILLEDNFSDPGSGWQEEEFPTSTSEYLNGVYVVRNSDVDYYYLGLFDDSFQDTAIVVDATQIYGPVSNDTVYGVGCRASQDGTGYLLVVGGDGYYAIFRDDGSDGGEFLVGWEESDVVNQGNMTNHLHAVCDGTYLALSVNGVLLAEAEDDTYTRGAIGLLGSSNEEAEVEVHFDDLMVYEP
jgi:serine/threonine-protein kinase